MKLIYAYALLLPRISRRVETALFGWVGATYGAAPAPLESQEWLKLERRALHG